MASVNHSPARNKKTTTALDKVGGEKGNSDVPLTPPPRQSLDYNHS